MRFLYINYINRIPAGSGQMFREFCNRRVQKSQYSGLRTIGEVNAGM